MGEARGQLRITPGYVTFALLRPAGRPSHDKEIRMPERDMIVNAVQTFLDVLFQFPAGVEQMPAISRVFSCQTPWNRC